MMIKTYLCDVPECVSTLFTTNNVHDHNTTANKDLYKRKSKHEAIYRTCSIVHTTGSMYES